MKVTVAQANSGYFCIYFIINRGNIMVGFHCLQQCLW